MSLTESSLQHDYCKYYTVGATRIACCRLQTATHRYCTQPKTVSSPSETRSTVVYLNHGVRTRSWKRTTDAMTGSESSDLAAAGHGQGRGLARQEIIDQEPQRPKNHEPQPPGTSNSRTLFSSTGGTNAISGASVRQRIHVCMYVCMYICYDSGFS